MIMVKVFHMKYDIDRLYELRKEKGRDSAVLKNA